MKFLKREKKEKEIKPNKEKKPRGSRVPRVILIGGWSLLVFSVGFGVYNNITAVSTHTVHEKEVIKEKLVDTTGLENYVKNFTKKYFTVSPNSKDQQEQREEMKKYLSENLALPSSLSKDVKEKVSVENMEVWGIQAVDDKKNVYSVLVKLSLKTDKSTVERAYSIDVYVKNNQFSVVKLPILAALPTKANVEVGEKLTTTAIEAEIREAVQGFLETFFAVYPKADEKELVYYGKQLQPIKDNLTFLEVNDIQVKEEKETMQVTCIVVYKDNDTKLTMEMPYRLTLEKLDDNKFAIKELK